MDTRRHIDLQLRAIEVMYKTERRRQSEAALRIFRQRADEILAALEGRARPHGDLYSRVVALRQALTDDAASARRARGEQPRNGGSEVGDLKRFA